MRVKHGLTEVALGKSYLARAYKSIVRLYLEYPFFFKTGKLMDICGHTVQRIFLICEIKLYLT